MDLEDVELSTDLIELREAIAENAHEVWAAPAPGREDGTYGPQRDDEKKETPDMGALFHASLIRKKNMIDVWRLDTIKLMKKAGV